MTTPGRRAMGAWATEELKRCKARIAALEQHVSDLEKVLTNVRKERDAAEAQVQEWGKRWSAEESRAVRAEQERDAALADNAALLESHRATGDHPDCPAIKGRDCECVLSRLHPGASLLEEVATLRGVQAQEQVDAMFIHEALGWAGEWPSSLPAPS